jgi:hypothetical protein
MTAHPAATQFERLAAVAPVPTARLEFPTGTARDPRKEWDATRKAFERSLRTWQSSFRSYLIDMRSALRQSVEEIGPERTGKIATTGIAGLRKVFADNTVIVRQWLDIVPEIDGGSDLGSVIADVPDIEEQYRLAVHRLVDMLADAYDRLYALELDFDPEANAADAPSYDNAEDLIRDLHASVDAG